MRRRGLSADATVVWSVFVGENAQGFGQWWVRGTAGYSRAPCEYGFRREEIDLHRGPGEVPAAGRGQGVEGPRGRQGGLCGGDLVGYQLRER